MSVQGAGVRVIRSKSPEEFKGEDSEPVVSAFRTTR